MLHDFINNFKVVQVIDPATHTADVDGDSVDLLHYSGVTFLALVGESGDTLSGSVKVELEVEDSDDDSSFSDVADADLQNYVAGTNDGCFGVIDAAAEDDAVYKGTYKGSSRYARPVINLVGTHTNGIPIGIVAILHGAENLPAA